MVHRPSIKKRSCFVLMPFGHSFDSFYKTVLKPAIEAAGFSCKRADEIYGNKGIMEDIWQSIWSARIVVADLSRKNMQQIATWAMQGKISPYISKHYSLAEAPQALIDMMERRVVGKAVVVL